MPLTNFLRMLICLVVIHFGLGATLPTAPPKAIYGALKVQGTQLCNEKGQAVQLRGIGSHEFQTYWYFMQPEAIEYLRKDWGITVTRVAVIVDSDHDGYTAKPSILNPVFRTLDAAIAQGIYVIVDWHVLYTGNPNVHKEAAKDFFQKVGERYPNCPNLIFEICNEPNGDSVSWKSAIRPYAAELVTSIRQTCKRNLILIGTGTWSQAIQDAAADPLPGDNLMYVCHFYAHSHRAWLRERIDQCLNGTYGHAIPIFISEWGTTDSAGNLNYTEEESTIWLEFLDQRGISWCNWCFADKAEGSTALKPGCATFAPWTDRDLSPSGLFVKKRVQMKNANLQK